jgi:hypothetical protein
VNKNEVSVKEYLNKIANINIINRILKFNKKLNSKEDKEIIIKKPLTIYSNKTKDVSSIRYRKRIVKKKFNKKNISSENLMDKRSQNDSSDNYNYNSSVRYQNSDYLINNHFDNSLFAQNKNNKFSKTLKFGSKTPMLNQQHEKKYAQNHSKRSDNRSLLENYFIMKNMEKTNNSEEQNYFYLNENNESLNNRQKNNKSFNNLNILNNFYNLDYNRRSPINKDINQKGHIDIEQIKIYKDSLDKLIPKQLKEMNFNY